MSNSVTLRGESRHFCTSCGSVFSLRAVVDSSSPQDEKWQEGAPSELGLYWVLFGEDMTLPVQAELWIRRGEKTLTLSDRVVSLGSLKGEIRYYRTLVLPLPPKTSVVGCVGSD